MTQTYQGLSFAVVENWDDYDHDIRNKKANMEQHTILTRLGPKLRDFFWSDHISVEEKRRRIEVFD